MSQSLMVLPQPTLDRATLTTEVIVLKNGVTHIFPAGTTVLVDAKSKLASVGDIKIEIYDHEYEVAS